ncbi:MAG TPA: hypothetical protein VFA04_02530 [Bryobacteraceae bacterium]|nr:hypothetical protein [Bryobacteraceae bacterium]
MIEKLEKIAAAGIQIIPAADLSTHFLFERDGFVSLVERTKENNFGNIGAPGLLTDSGLAVLLWRGGEGWFVRRGFEQRATEDQVRRLRAFATDLEQALKD